MAAARGGWSAENRLRIQKNHQTLADNVDAEHILVPCFSEGLLSRDDRVEIESIGRPNRKMSMLLDRIQYSGSTGFDKFIKVLRDQSYVDMAEKLIATDVREANPNPFAWFDLLDQGVKGHVLTESELSKIAFCAGRNFEVVLRELGLRQVTIEMSLDEHRDKTTAITYLLIDWLHSRSKNATVEALVTAIKAILDLQINDQIYRIIDMDRFISVVQGIKL